MEIVLDNVKYNSKKYRESIDNVSYTFKNSITFCGGIKGNIIKELLFLEHELKCGYVMLNEKGCVYDIAYLSNCSIDDYKKKNIYEEIAYLNEYYRLNYSNIDKRINEAVKMANLEVKLLYKDFKYMSSIELKLSKLIISLFLNAKVFILNNFEKGLDYKYQEYIKKLLVKLNKMYNKNIIIFSNDIEYYMNIIKNIVIFNDGKIVFEGTKKDLYNKNLYQYINKPNIISFINYLEDNNHKFDDYIDIKELLKAIYRDVENR